MVEVQATLVKSRISESLKDRDHEKRITYLEAKQEAAMEFAQIAAGQSAESKLIGKDERE